MKKKLGIGIQDYRTLIEKSGYFVDKTMLIADFLNDLTQVSLITRPRRFGKTLNMSMLAEFFDIKKNSKDIFQDTHIMRTEYAQNLNTYPVIFISFKDAKEDTAKGLYKSLFSILYNCYYKYRDLFASDRINEDLKYNIQYMFQMLNTKGFPSEENINEMKQALVLLCQFLYEYYAKKVMLFIDEYDTPFIEAYQHHYYDEVHHSLAAMFTRTLKGNDFLEKAMLTGIQRIAKENIFSGLNNLSVYGVDSKQYAQYFGLEENETKELLEYFGLLLTEEVRAMYDGYQIGDIDIFNPWSIINYAKQMVLKPYWVNTASNIMIKNLMDKMGRDFQEDYEHLITYKGIDVDADLGTSYFEDANEQTLWALLINAGYLTITRMNEINNYHIKIPNDEVRSSFKDLTMHIFDLDNKKLNRIDKALRNKDVDMFIMVYREYLQEVTSYHDFIDENSYQMLMLGLCAYLYASHDVSSNREAGIGRYDIVLKSKHLQYPSYVLEFKYTKDKHVNLAVLADTAVQQIEQKRYTTGLSGEVICIGLAHCGKECAAAYKIMKLKP